MLQSLLAPVDLYCERTDAALWSEPVNLLTNLVFIATGLFGVVMVRRWRADLFAEVLTWWIVAVGMGSTLFHVFANRLTILADVLPIAIFTLATTVFALRRMFGLDWPGTILAFVAFYVVAGLLIWLVPDRVREVTNGSIGYLPALLGLVFFGTLLAARGHPAGRYFLVAFAIFAVSLFCRSIDENICPALPIGTHFLWHMLNGVMLGVVIAAVARHGHPLGG